MERLLSRAARIAASEASVFIQGESGSGKEVLARALHANSQRREKPFRALNVAALPLELVEAEYHVSASAAGLSLRLAQVGILGFSAPGWRAMM